MPGSEAPGAAGDLPRRTFIAVELPAPVRLALAAMAAELARQWPGDGVRWVGEGSLHLTLRFLGDTAPDQVDALRRGLEQIASRHGPFDLHLAEAGAFPNPRRPRVIWVGLADPEGALGRVQREVERLARSLGWEREERAFKPHLTLGRVRPEARPPQSGWSAAVPAAVFRATGISLMGSRLKPTGAEYCRLHCADLAVVSG
ncbi:MAG: RNA 2',3'-cyclic phosphodiesterase [Gemmatimonadota bacterium]